jgi:hypothetical protein
MSDVSFAIHLGGGLYMDSSGKLHQGTRPSGPVYTPPFELPIDPKKVKDALTEVKGALEKIDKNQDIQLLFHVWKADTTLLKVLSGVGKIAGMIAPVFAVAAFAIEVVKLLGFLKEGPSALERKIDERFNERHRQVNF